MRMIIGVSGASGTILAIALLKALKHFPEIQTHLVTTPTALRTLEYETGQSQAEFLALGDIVYSCDDLGASIASGTFRTAGMVVVPCSMKTLAGIVHGYSENLLLRAADVCLKERRKLVLVPREIPLSTLHLENLLKASQYGAVIMPPLMTFYNHPITIDDQVNHLVAKILLQFDVENPDFQPWQGIS